MLGHSPPLEKGWAGESVTKLTKIWPLDCFLNKVSIEAALALEQMLTTKMKICYYRVIRRF